MPENEVRKPVCACFKKIQVFIEKYRFVGFKIQVCGLQNTGLYFQRLACLAIPCQNLGCAPQHVMDFFLFKCGGK